MAARLTAGQDNHLAPSLLWPRLGLFSLVALLFLAAPAPAVILQPAQTARPGVPEAAPLGRVLAESTSIFWSDYFLGELYSQVIENSSGFLSFTYRFTMHESTITPINRIVALDFSESLVDVRYALLAPGDVAPQMLSRWGGMGDGVTISFATPGSFVPTGVGAGQSSALIVIETDAIDFTADGFTLIYDGGSDCGYTFSPVRGVPEPGTLMIALLAGLPLIGLRGLRHRQRI